MVVLFLTALAIAFSGAMMPGPLLTYTIRQSLSTGPWSGFIIITGHALLEIILIALILAGFDVILQSSPAQISIGIIGGLLLVYMGYDMFYGSLRNKIKIEMDNNSQPNPRNMVLSGFIVSAANPYFLLWWAIIGLGFLIQAYKSFAVAGIIIFFLGHISADFIWYGLISVIVGTTRRFIKEKLYRIIIAGLGALLVFFGGSFFYSAVLSLLKG
ncbi:MAG: LysE family transporter [Syntrophomonas sp.]|nr:LysE family transporter [Syntrophomonas sp.]